MTVKNFSTTEIKLEGRNNNTVIDVYKQQLRVLETKIKFPESYDATLNYINSQLIPDHIENIQQALDLQRDTTKLKGQIEKLISDYEKPLDDIEFLEKSIEKDIKDTNIITFKDSKLDLQIEELEKKHDEKKQELISIKDTLNKMHLKATSFIQKHDEQITDQNTYSLNVTNIKSSYQEETKIVINNFQNDIEDIKLNQKKLIVLLKYTKDNVSRTQDRVKEIQQQGFLPSEEKDITKWIEKCQKNITKGLEKCSESLMKINDLELNIKHKIQKLEKGDRESLESTAKELKDFYVGILDQLIINKHQINTTQNDFKSFTSNWKKLEEINFQVDDLLYNINTQVDEYQMIKNRFSTLEKLYSNQTISKEKIEEEIAKELLTIDALQKTLGTLSNKVNELPPSPQKNQNLLNILESALNHIKEDISHLQDTLNTKEDSEDSEDSISQSNELTESTFEQFGNEWAKKIHTRVGNKKNNLEEDSQGSIQIGYYQDESDIHQSTAESSDSDENLSLSVNNKSISENSKQQQVVISPSPKEEKLENNKLEIKQQSNKEFEEKKDNNDNIKKPNQTQYNQNKSTKIFNSNISTAESSKSEHYKKDASDSLKDQKRKLPDEKQMDYMNLFKEICNVSHSSDLDKWSDEKSLYKLSQTDIRLEIFKNTGKIIKKSDQVLELNILSILEINNIEVLKELDCYSNRDQIIEKMNAYGLTEKVVDAINQNITKIQDYCEKSDTKLTQSEIVTIAITHQCSKTSGVELKMADRYKEVFSKLNELPQSKETSPESCFSNPNSPFDYETYETFEINLTLNSINLTMWEKFCKWVVSCYQNLSSKSLTHDIKLCDDFDTSLIVGDSENFKDIES